MTVQERVVEAAGRLSAAGIDPVDARIDAEVLARMTLGWDRVRFLTDGRREASADFGARYGAAVARRLRREPVAYITGVREFWGLDFVVTPSVLIPRPETELLVEHSLVCLDAHASPEDGALLVVDVGTGSGCLAVSLATERPNLRLTATDISPAALDVARENATRHRVEERIEFVLGNLLDAVARDPDLIVSNPPYIPTSEALPPEVGHEPASGLFSGIDGLDAIRGLVSQAAVRLRRGGSLVFEFGLGQATAIGELIDGTPVLRLERIVEDLHGIPRVVVATRR